MNRLTKTLKKSDPLTETKNIDGWQVYITRPQEKRDLPPILFSHATGFSALTYKEFLQQWSDKTGRIIYSYDVRGFGDTQHKFSKQHQVKTHNLWLDLAEDLAGVIATIASLESIQRTNDIILSGHSSGAVFSILAGSILETKKLVIFDPVALSFFQEKGWNILALINKRHKHPVALSTANRKKSFADKEQALAYYQKKSFFKDFTDDALNNYLDGSFRMNGTYNLKFNPHDEALIFETQPLNMARYLKTYTNEEFRNHTDITIYGVESSIMLGQYPCLYLGHLFKNAKILILPHGGHMFPLEKYTDLIDAL